jgi:hypothetical protein
VYAKVRISVHPANFFRNIGSVHIAFFTAEYAEPIAIGYSAESAEAWWRRFYFKTYIIRLTLRPLRKSR